MYTNLVTITWTRYLVALIPWNMMLHQRHFHRLFSSLSVRSYSQMDEIELRTSIFPVCDGLWLKRVWYFECELPDRSATSKHFLINDEQHYWDIKFVEGYLSITNLYYPKTKSSTRINYCYLSISWCIYIYI